MNKIQMPNKPCLVTPRLNSGFHFAGAKANRLAKSMTLTDRDRLIRKVEETFVAIPKPECTKRVARALDDEWFPSRERVEELRSLDEEENWREVGPDDIRDFSDVLFWISPDGFRFYFPAFLRYSIMNWDGSHDRVQLECMEVIGSQPCVLDSLSAREAATLAEILAELSVDPSGSNYDCDQSIRALELHAAKAGRGANCNPH